MRHCIQAGLLAFRFCFQFFGETDSVHDYRFEGGKSIFLYLNARGPKPFSRAHLALTFPNSLRILPAMNWEFDVRFVICPSLILSTLTPGTSWTRLEAI